LKVFRFGRILAATLAFAVIAPGVAAASSHEGGSMQMGDDGMMQEMNSALADLEALEGEEFEVAYVNQIIPHHQGALEMAQAVVERAPNPEVREAAARIIEDQEREIGELTTFLRDTHGREVNPDERMAMDPAMNDRIRNADPATAEKMFLLGMREHHESAVQMGEIALRKAQSQEILDQARTMVDSQRAEQEEFAVYLRQFYGIEAPTPTGDMMQAMQIAAGDGSMQMPQTGGPSPVGLAVAAGALVAAAVAAGAYILRRAFG
jgi:uncharacterized protein (DUF305 family)